MPQFVGEQRKKLREAIIAGFSPQALRDTLKDNDLSASTIQSNSDFQEQVNLLIDTAFQVGWLAKLCLALENAREGNPVVHEPIGEVRKWFEKTKEAFQKPAVKAEISKTETDLKDRPRATGAEPPTITVVFSSVGTDAAWKKNFLDIGGFMAALEPCDAVDTLDRYKQSKDNVASILRDIEDADLFVAFLSRRYTLFQQSADEIQRGLESLRRTADMAESRRKLLAVVLDQESLKWLKGEAHDLIDRKLVIVSEFFQGKERKAIVAGESVDDSIALKIVNLGAGLRGYFDDSPRLLPEKAPIGPELPPEKLKRPASGKIVILGEPRNASVPGAVTAADELVRELATRNVPHQRWDDGWRRVGRPVDDLKQNPLFVRTIVDQKQTNANEVLGGLTRELNASFGFQFDDDSEQARAVTDRPKVIWRPDGPNWTPAASGPLLFSNGDRPIEFARWLALQLGIDVASSNVIVHYEDPVDNGDVDNLRRREAVEESLRGAIASGEPSLFPDSLPFGYQQLQEVIDSIVGKLNKLTVLAVHDMRSKVGDPDDTLRRFRDIDRSIEASLARKNAENAPLMRVAVLLRNWRLFPALEFSRNSRINKWQLLRIFKQSDGSLVPDVANVERLREYAANLVSQHK